MSKDWREQGVPFKDGKYLKYRYHEHEMVSADSFSGEMLIQHSDRGLSAATIWWLCADNGHTYPMFLTDFVELVRESKIDYGTANGTWKFVKRGQNYGIALA